MLLSQLFFALLSCTILTVHEAASFGGDTTFNAKALPPNFSDAIKLGKLDLVKKFIQETNPNTPLNSKGHTPLHIAAKYDRLNIVQFLLSLGSDININPVDDLRNTPIVYAASHGNLEMVRALYEASLRQPCPRALMAATKRLHLNVATYLVKEGVKIPLDGVIEAIRTNRRFMDLFRDNGFNFQIKDEYQRTILMRALSIWEYEVFLYILNIPEIDVNERNYIGKNALLLAFELKKRECLVELCKKGAKIDVDSGDLDRLEEYFEKSHEEYLPLIKDLIDHGALESTEDVRAKFGLILN